MARFRIGFEWETAPECRSAELASTWARLQIDAAGSAVTHVESTRTRGTRDGIYVPLYPIAEWIANNWWVLFHHRRADDPRDPRHNLLFAREGFALPDLAFLPSETTVELVWQPLPGGLHHSVSFLGGGRAAVPSSIVRSEFQRVVEAVLERVGPDSPLAREWRAIQEAEQDPEQLEFCAMAGRLGEDPFDISADVVDQMEQVARLLPAQLAVDVTDAAPADQIGAVALRSRRFIDQAATLAPPGGRWDQIRSTLLPELTETDRPFLDGYRAAKSLRVLVEHSGPIGDLDSFLHERLGPVDSRELGAAPGVDAISAPTRSGAPSVGIPGNLRDDSRRFRLTRAIFGHLMSAGPRIVARGRTDFQKRNRAFAAEFLAPEASLRQLISTPWLGPEDIDDLAAEFQVSSEVIRHQVSNHRLAVIAS